MPILLMLIFSLTSHAFEVKNEAGKTFTSTEAQKICQPPCLAHKDYSSKSKSFKWKNGNPASEFCIHAGGTDQSVTHANSSQDSLCSFKDGSYILSWDLYRRAFTRDNPQ